MKWAIVRTRCGWRQSLGLLIAFPLLIGCSQLAAQQAADGRQLPTPTISTYFSNTQTLSTPSPMSFDIPLSESISRPTSAPAATTRPREADRIAEVPIYDDALDKNWSLAQSHGMRYNLSDTTYIHSGKVAAAVTPTQDFGTLFFTVRKGSTSVYSATSVLGVSFWLNSGAGAIETDQLAVTVLGSNAYTYWVADDTSVRSDVPVTQEQPLFPETRLYFLGINRTIPPNTWVEVVVWQDDLIYAPQYTSITGIYIKNDKQFSNTFYIDHVSLLVAK